MNSDLIQSWKSTLLYPRKSSLWLLVGVVIIASMWSQIFNLFGVILGLFMGELTWQYLSRKFKCSL